MWLFAILTRFKVWIYSYCGIWSPWYDDHLYYIKATSAEPTLNVKETFFKIETGIWGDLFRLQKQINVHSEISSFCSPLSDALIVCKLFSGGLVKSFHELQDRLLVVLVSLSLTVRRKKEELRGKHVFTLLTSFVCKHCQFLSFQRRLDVWETWYISFVKNF